MVIFYFFFFQAEDGIRGRDVTGVQTCALPISHHRSSLSVKAKPGGGKLDGVCDVAPRSRPYESSTMAEFEPATGAAEFMIKRSRDASRHDGAHIHARLISRPIPARSRRGARTGGLSCTDGIFFFR